MKILYIYHEYKNRRMRYGYEMQKFGHDVKFLDMRRIAFSKVVKSSDIRSYQPDLVWLLSPQYIENGSITEGALQYIKSKKIPLVVYGTFDTQSPWASQDVLWKWFDFLFIHHLEFSKYLKIKGMNAHYMPIGFYPNQYYPIQKRETIGLSFAGNTHPRRVDYIRSLLDFDIKVYGKEFRKSFIPAETYSSHQEQNDIYARSKINLDLPFIDVYDDKFHIKNRFFEVPGSRNFLLTVRTTEALNIFDESMVGYFDDNIPSMREEIYKYLRDDKIRFWMAVNAYKEAINKHTFYDRFKKMFEIIEGKDG